jgi:prophage regulatory protein
MYLDLKAVVARLSVSKNTIWRWSRTGDFPQPVRLGPRVTRWALADIERWEHERAKHGA